MKQEIRYVLMTCIFFAAAFFASRLFIQGEKEVEFAVEEDGMEEDVAGRLAWMNKMLADPATGQIPADARMNELNYSATLPVERKFAKYGDEWVQRGPYNVGG